MCTWQFELFIDDCHYINHFSETFYRFAVAFILCIFFLGRKTLFAENWKDISMGRKAGGKSQMDFRWAPIETLVINFHRCRNVIEVNECSWFDEMAAIANEMTK